jgi:hypothetical protein
MPATREIVAATSLVCYQTSYGMNRQTIPENKAAKDRNMVKQTKMTSGRTHHASFLLV